MFHLARSLSKLVRPTLCAIRAAPKRVPMGRLVYAFSTANNNNSSEFEKLKQDSKAFYENQVQRVHELKDMSQWQTLVEQASGPVVIDLYADWCGPCKQLTPILEKQAQKDGNWKLVKINIDTFPTIAHELGIKSVPTVLLLANQQFVDAFSGFPDDTTLKRFLDNIKKSLDSGFLENTKKQQEFLKKLEKARGALVNREYPEAEVLIKEILPHLDSSLQPLTQLMHAHALVEQNKFQQYEEVLKAFKRQFQKEIQSNDPQFQFVTEYIRELDVIHKERTAPREESQTIAKLKEAVKADPSNLDSKFALANQYITSGLNQDGLLLLLQIVKANKNWEGKKANNLILQVFKTLGNSSDLTVKYRKLYQRLLY